METQKFIRALVRGRQYTSKSVETGVNEERDRYHQSIAKNQGGKRQGGKGEKKRIEDIASSQYEIVAETPFQGGERCRRRTTLHVRNMKQNRNGFFFS